MMMFKGIVPLLLIAWTFVVLWAALSRWEIAECMELSFCEDEARTEKKRILGLSSMLISGPWLTYWAILWWLS